MKDLLKIENQHCLIDFHKKINLYDKIYIYLQTFLKNFTDFIKFNTCFY